MAPQFDTADAQNASKGKVDDGVRYLEQQGRTSQDIQAYVRDLAQNNPNEYRQTIDAVYNRVHTDAKSNPTLNGLLPQIDLTDAAVDPKGAAGDRANFSGDNQVQGVVTDQQTGRATGYGGTSPDGSSGMFMNDKGQSTAFVRNGNEVQVTSSAADGSVNTFKHTDVDPNSAKLDQNTGELTMTRTGLAQGESGTVTIHPGGAETTSIKNAEGKVTTIDRTQAGGDITGFHSDAPAMAKVHCENGKWSGLPGTDGKDPQNVHVESNGQITYEVGSKKMTMYENGVTKTVDGNVTLYRDGDKTLRNEGGKWFANKDGSSEYVTVSEPWMDNNGNLRAAVGGTWGNKDKDYVLGGGKPTDGHEDGWTFSGS